jgi:thiol:disulfide interchange protein
MHSTRLVFAACLTLLLASTAAAQNEVSVRFELDRASAAPGESVEVRAVVTVKEGWHVYGSSETQGIPTVLVVGAAPGATAEGAVKTPTPHVEEVPYLGKMKILRGTFTLSQKMILAADASGTVSIPAELKFQACSEGLNSVCLMPDAKTAALALTVAAPAAVATPDPEAPADAKPEPAAPADATPAEDGPEVAATLSVSPADAAPGDVVEVRALVRLKKGWHLYGVGETKGIPSALTVVPGPGAALEGDGTHPAFEIEEVQYVGSMRIVHGDTLVYSQKIKLAADASGSVSLQAKFTFQACSEGENSVCLQPGSEDKAFTIQVKAAGGAPSTETPTTEAPTAEIPTAEPAPDDADVSHPGALIAASIGLGLAMLLMPCTYPMIPITVSIFSKGKTMSRAQTIWRAAAYAGGIVISFVAVGGVVQVLFGGEGQGAVSALATNPWVNLGIGIVFLYFAFSFFGYYELGLPEPLRKFMQFGNAKQDSDGTVPVWSLFLMGLFFVLTSYTCGAPVVLGLFATAAQDPHPMSIIGATFVFALTVAAPFFVLALVPGGVRLLPKSGSWFSVFKVVLAFVELGFAVKFFRGSDLQWELGLLSRPVTLGLWTALCLASVIYLHGYFPIKFPHDPKLDTWSPRRYGFGWLFVLSAAYFGYGMLGNELHSPVEAFVLSDPEQGIEENTVVFGLPYRTDLAGLEEAKAWAKKTGRGAFLTFTGHT